MQRELDFRKLRQTLCSTFGFERLRAGQRDIIRSVLGGRDTLAIMPTGAGKSLCYQLPALHFPGMTVVVSPLLSLMKDQADKLKAVGVEIATLNSTLNAAEEEEALRRIGDGAADILFVTPERLARPAFPGIFDARAVDLVVVDEAHCISHWGHDFRPAFLEIARAVDALGRPPMLALTATATPPVRDDILAGLGMRDARVIDTGMYRDNLHYSVRQTTNHQEKLDALRQLVGDEPGSCIVYTATVKDAQRVHAALVAAGVRAECYHGRMPARAREEAQERFMSGETPLVVATNAFGMGIDKADVRTVIHYQAPGSLDAYYQESGRAGRDGGAARCVLFFAIKDKAVQQFFLAGRYPSLEQVSRVYETLATAARKSGGATLAELNAALPDFPANKLAVALNLLREHRIVALDRRRRYRTRDGAGAGERIGKAVSAYEARATRDCAILDAVIQYAQSAQCRWARLLQYFGVAWDRDACGTCDNCLHPPTVDGIELPDTARPTHAPPAATWQPGDAVKVRRYGRGEVVLANAEQVAIAFPDGATRTFLVRYVKRVGAQR